MRRRMQADDLGLQDDRAVVAIMRQMVDGGFDRHADALLSLGHKSLPGKELSWTRDQGLQHRTEKCEAVFGTIRCANKELERTF
jgi:hypothetical protein